MMNTCRFCKEYVDDGVKYNVRHYAHHECYLRAGKPLVDLSLWQLESFPYALLRTWGKLATVKQLLVMKTLEAFQYADNQWSKELEKAFGSKAGDARYLKIGRGDEGSMLRYHHDKRTEAMEKWERMKDLWPDDVRAVKQL